MKNSFICSVIVEMKEESKVSRFNGFRNATVAKFLNFQDYLQLLFENYFSWCFALKLLLIYFFSNVRYIGNTMLDRCTIIFPYLLSDILLIYEKRRLLSVTFDGNSILRVLTRNNRWRKEIYEPYDCVLFVDAFVCFMKK